MRPPICAICGETDKRAELISFALSEKDRKENERFNETGFVGHPAGLEWFCGKHARQAKKYSHLQLAEAMAKMKEKPTSDK